MTWHKFNELLLYAMHQPVLEATVRYLEHRLSSESLHFRRQGDLEWAFREDGDV